MSTVENITRDAGSRITTWIADNQKYKVERDSTGKPLVVRTVPDDLLNGVLWFSYSSTGQFTGLKGNDITPWILDELLDDARNGGSIPLAAKLTSAGFVRGTSDPMAPSLARNPWGETLQPLPTPVLFYNDPAGFSLNGGSGSSGFTKTLYNDSMLSPGAVQVTSRTDTSSGTTNLDKINLSMTFSASDVLELHFYVPDKSKITGVVLMFSNDNNGFTNYATVAFKDTPTYKDFENGWNIIRFKMSELLAPGKYFNSFSLGNAIQTIRTQYSANTSGTPIVFDSLWKVTPGRPRVVPIFDDAWSTAYDYNNGYGFYTLMKSKGLKGTIAVIGSLIGTTGYMTHAQLREVYDNGFDLIPHGVGYGSVNGNLMLFADTASRIANIKQNVRFLLAMGFTRGLDIYSYPQGQYDEALMAAMRDIGFKMARGTNEIIGVDELASREYRMHLPGFDIGNRNAAATTAFLDAVKAVGGTAFLYGHKVAEAYSAQTTARQDLVTILDYIVNQGFENLTFSQYRDNVNGARMMSF